LLPAGVPTAEEDSVNRQIIDASTIFGFWPKRRADTALTTLLRLMEENSVSRACTISARGIFYDFVAGNQETWDAARAHSQLIPVGTVNPCRWIGCLDEAQRLIDQGVRLLRFFPQYQEWHIGQAPFRKLLREVLVPSGVPLMIPAVLGVTAIGDMAADIRNPVIIESMRYTHWAEAVVVMQEVSNVYVETHLGGWLEWVKAEVGTDRLVFGSNAPLSYIPTAKALIDHQMLDERDKALIFGGNLRRVLGL
jgi:predicted TIM-barrel fold metal-dependent hydrolase